MGDQLIDYRPCLQTAVMQVPPCLFSGVLVQSPTSQSVNSLQLPLSASMAWEEDEMLAFDTVIGMRGMESYSTALDTVAQFDDAASPSAYVCRPPADNLQMDDVVDDFSAATDTQFLSSDYANNPMALQTQQESFDFYIPREEVAELEWLSQFVEGASLDVPYPYTGLAGAAPSGISQLHVDECAITRAARSKRPRISTAASVWHSVVWPVSSSPPFDISPTQPNWTSGKSNGSRGGTRREGGGSESEAGGVRRCTHCASEKTPQWRTGPLGPKTLCNACGVRYKSGRLVPEYRPAASPTFVLTQHSNSHRKIMELRRLKALLRHHGNLLPSSAVARPPLVLDDYGLI